MNNDEMLKAISEMIKQELKPINNRLDDIDKELKEFRAEVNQRFDTLEDKLNDLEGTNGGNHIDSNVKLDKISNDLDYLTHKEAQNEKDVFTIKKRLNII